MVVFLPASNVGKNGVMQQQADKAFFVQTIKNSP